MTTEATNGRTRSAKSKAARVCSEVCNHFSNRHATATSADSRAVEHHEERKRDGDSAQRKHQRCSRALFSRDFGSRLCFSLPWSWRRLRSTRSCSSSSNCASWLLKASTRYERGSDEASARSQQMPYALERRDPLQFFGSLPRSVAECSAFGDAVQQPFLVETIHGRHHRGIRPMDLAIRKHFANRGASLRPKFLQYLLLERPQLRPRACAENGKRLCHSAIARRARGRQPQKHTIGVRALHANAAGGRSTFKKLS